MWTGCAGEEVVGAVEERREAAGLPSLPVGRALAPMYRPIVAQGEGRSRGPAGVARAGRREAEMLESPSPCPAWSGQVLWWRAVILAEGGEKRQWLAPTGWRLVLPGAAIVTCGGVDQIPQWRYHHGSPLQAFCNGSRHEYGSWPSRTDKRFERRGAR
jgi:hypothetical protein